MAEDAFENTLGIVNGDTTLDFTFGHGQDEVEFEMRYRTLVEKVWSVSRREEP